MHKRSYPHKPELLSNRTVSFVSALCFAVGFALLGVHFLSKGHALAPSTPPAQICNNNSILGGGPTSAPAGAVTVPSGDNSNLNPVANTTYWFAPGTHTLGTGQFDQIVPANNDTFIGAPGAILDGQHLNNYAFTQHATGVTVEYLTIQNFGQTGGNNNEGVVNHDAGHNWTISHNTITGNAGAGVFVGSGDNINYNCLSNNGQYGFSAYEPNGVSNVTLDHNEISGNDTYNWEAVVPGCGCTGGGKFWATTNATITNNYIHDNLSVGLWADTNNNGFDVEDNYISNNYSEGIIYEISYNALFKDNTLIDNAWGAGPITSGFPSGAIYISESGGDARVANAFNYSTLSVTGNAFTDNWSGVVLWENANRYCASTANTSGGDCTLVNPTVANLTTCANASDLATTPYINDCRWKTQNVSVDNNVFNFTPSHIGSNCTIANDCGFNGIFSEYGSYVPFTAWVVPLHISNSQNNVFSSNTYNGPWNFMGFAQGDAVTWSQWNSGFDDWNGSGDHFNAQDAGSTYNGTPSQTPLPSTPGNVTAQANGSTSVSVSWSASSDIGGPGLGGYDVLRDGNQIASVGANTTTYNDAAVTAGTQYSYTIKAFDTSAPANISTASAAALVTVPVSAQAPTVGISSIANNALLHGSSITISSTATPTSGNSISKVELLVNGIVVQTLTTAPFTFTLNSLVYGDGGCTVAVRATDNHSNAGLQQLSATITNGDINTDNKVSIADLAIMAGNWGKQSGATYNQGDINGDGKITIADLAVLATNWSKQW